MGDHGRFQGDDRPAVAQGRGSFGTYVQQRRETAHGGTPRLGAFLWRRTSRSAGLRPRQTWRSAATGRPAQKDELDAFLGPWVLSRPLHREMHLLATTSRIAGGLLQPRMEKPMGWGFSSFPPLPPMLIEQRIDAVVVQAPAKVNLFLEVPARRPDGYHEIATLMVAVSLYDTLVLTEDTSEGLSTPVRCPRTSCRASQPGVPGRPAPASAHRLSVQRTFAWKKRIPLAAGLAGGSTDAAAALAGLNRLWDLGRTFPSWPDSERKSAVTCRSFSPRRPPGVPAAERGSSLYP